MLKMASFLAVGLLARTACAADIETVQKASDAIMQTTLEVCGRITPEGSSQSGKVNAEVKASLGFLSRFLKSLPGLDASVGGTIEKNSYQGLRQQDLSTVMTANIGCRERTFAILHKDINAPDAPSVSASLDNRFIPQRPATRLQPVASPGRPGWLVDERTGCNLWDEMPQNNETVTWSGDCSTGVAFGNGVVVFTMPGWTETAAGTMVNGRLEGEVTTIDERPYVPPPASRVQKRRGPFRNGLPVSGFATVWTENGTQISGILEPDSRPAGPVVATTIVDWAGMSVPARFEGTFDHDQLMPDTGWWTFSPPNQPPIVTHVVRGCYDSPPGRCGP